MGTNCGQTWVIFTLKILLLTSLSRSSYVVADNRFPLQSNECPYPCLLAPVGTTSGCPPLPASEVLLPPPLPPSPSSTVYYSPPLPSGWFYLPPAADFPFYPPPDYLNNYFAPPPPNPILPYFPFYYKSPPPPSDFSSASDNLGPPLRAFCIFIIAQLLFTKSL